VKKKMERKESDLIFHEGVMNVHQPLNGIAKTVYGVKTLGNMMN
jgi:hypothetical protein